VFLTVGGYYSGGVACPSCHLKNEASGDSVEEVRTHLMEPPPYNGEEFEIDVGTYVENGKSEVQIIAHLLPYHSGFDTIEGLSYTIRDEEGEIIKRRASFVDRTRNARYLLMVTGKKKGAVPIFRCQSKGSLESDSVWSGE
jgi:hypothetical protein